MKNNKQAVFSTFLGSTNKRALLSTLIVGGALTLVGCGSNSGVDCEDGWHREFKCGKDLSGLQPQQCVDGNWESINFCALPDGTKHPDADDYPFDPDIGNKNNLNNNIPDNNNVDDPTVTRPTSPEGCVELNDPDVNGGKTLTSKDCYVVGQNLTVREGTLTIDPGVTLLFKKDVQFVIEGSGRLNAVGEGGKAIWFEGAQKEKGFWGGIVIRETGSGENTLSNVVIRHAGGASYDHRANSRGGVYVNGASLNVSESLFEQNLYAGLNGVSEVGVIKLESSTFKNNEVAVRLIANQLATLKSDLVFADNKDENDEDSNYIVLGLDAKITKKGKWPAYSYRNDAHINIESAIEIEAGAIFQSGKEKAITISGDNASLRAEGTTDKPIVFTSRNESSSSWRGIVFTDTNSPDNSLKHVVIEKAGDSNYSHQAYANGALFVWTDNVVLAMDNVTFRNNANVALRLYSNVAKVTLDNSNFMDNGVPINTGANQIGSFGENLTFDGAAGQTIQIDKNEVNKTATWPTYTIPYESFNGVLIKKELSLSSGSTFILHENTGFKVEGLEAALIAKADGTERITMKGKSDVRGVWRGVYFESKNPNNELDGVDIINAGQSGWSHQKWTHAALFLNTAASATVKDTKITGSEGYGVSVMDGSTLLGCEGLSVTGSKEGDFTGITGTADCI